MFAVAVLDAWALRNVQKTAALLVRCEKDEKYRSMVGTSYLVLLIGVLKLSTKI
jgi:hypothetical protein